MDSTLPSASPAMDHETRQDIFSTIIMAGMGATPIPPHAQLDPSW